MRPVISMFASGVTCGALLLIGWPTLGGATEDFRFLTSTVTIPERGEVASCLVLIQTNRFVFMPPPDWIARVKSEQKKVTLLPRDQSASISVSFQLESVSKPRKLEVVELREQIRRRIPKGTILREFPCYSGAGEGQGFDVEQVAANKTRMTTRLAWVALPGVTVEFSLTAASKEFDKFHLSLGNLLTSFNKEPRT